MDHTIDHKTLGDMFQEIIVEFSEMGPTELDTFENKVLDVIYRIGKGLMQWKLEEWNTEIPLGSWAGKAYWFSKEHLPDEPAFVPSTPTLFCAGVL